jgi:hypothetical protein
MALGTLFIVVPLAAAVPAAAFLYMFARSRSIVALLTALLWLAYMAYESAMKLRILCTGECNIRVDLMIIYPVLMLLSAVAIVRFFVVLRRRRRAELEG